jgi:hypothetical protein
MSSNQTSTILGQQLEWLLYTRSTVAPFLGVAKAATREKALAWATSQGWPNSIAVPLETPYPSESRIWIERDFKMLGTIIPASSAKIRDRHTSYFFRKEAIAWAQLARRNFYGGNLAEMCRRTAKQHLALYRKMKGVNC